jgi:hypothetical protein
MFSLRSKVVTVSDRTKRTWIYNSYYPCHFGRIDGRTWTFLAVPFLFHQSNNSTKMFAFPILLALFPLATITTLAAPSLKTYPEAFPSPIKGYKDPLITSDDPKNPDNVQLLDLPALQASNDDYRLGPQIPGLVW